MSYTANNFLEVDEYWDSGDVWRTQSFTLSEALLTPPRQFSDTAIQIWSLDVDRSRQALENNTSMNPSYNRADNGHPYIPGPFNVEMDYSREKRAFVFTIESTLTEAKQTYEVDARKIIKHANGYRETFLTRDFQDSVTRAAGNQSILREMDSMRKNNHAFAANIVQKALNESGIECKDIGFCKKLFTLMQAVSPMNARLAAEMSKIYDPNGFEL